MIKEKALTEWTQDVIDLARSWQDGFPTLQEIRSTYASDSPREEL